MNNTKAKIAARYSVSQRTVDLWVVRGILPAPIKLGTSKQARVRWTDEQVAELDRNLAALSRSDSAAHAA